MNKITVGAIRAARPIIQHVLGRVHCCSRNVAALREVRGSMKPDYVARMTRAARRELTRMVCTIHASNRRLYDYVMKGR